MEFRTAKNPGKQENRVVNPAQEGQIRQRAQEIYLQRGGTDGSALDDWLQAEAEILQAHASAPKYAPAKQEAKASRAGSGA